MADEPRFAPRLIRAACGIGDVEAIERLSAVIILELNIRDAAAKATPSKSPVRALGCLATSEAANFAYRMLRACERHKKPPPGGLVDLLQRLLRQDRPPGKVQASKRQLAKEYFCKHPGASIREIAEASSASPSTVHGWKQHGII